MKSVSNWLVIIYHGEELASYYSVNTKFFGGNDEIHVRVKNYIADNFSNEDNHITYEAHHTGTTDMGFITDANLLETLFKAFNCLKFGVSLKYSPKYKVL